MVVPILRSSECRIWWADIHAQSIETMTTVLSEVELGRAARYRRHEDRLRFVTAAWLLRTTAAAQLGTTPEAVVVERKCGDCDKPHGRPRIRTDGPPLYTSISHSGNRAALALCTACEVGVDVEEVVATSGGIARAALTEGERAALGKLPEQDREAGFIDLWVRKEAVLKATGHGLRIPPHKIEVTGPREAPALLAWPFEETPGTVDIRTLDPGNGYTGVVAILADGEPVQVSQSDATLIDRTKAVATISRAA